MMNMKQERLDVREGVFKNEPDLISGQTKQRYKTVDDDVFFEEFETNTPGQNVEIKEEIIECEEPKIERLDLLPKINSDSTCVGFCATTIKKELENTTDIRDLKEDISEYIQSKVELVTTHCDLPTLKNENTEPQESLTESCGGEEKERISNTLKNDANVINNVKKRRKQYHCQKTFRLSREKLFNVRFGIRCYETCYYCGQFFLTKLQFLCHFIVIHCVKKVTKFCKRKFGQSKHCRCKNCLKSIFKHLPTANIFHFNTTALQCEICYKTLSTKTNLNNHMKIHTGKNLFKCEICSNEFTQKGNLKLHVKIHMREKSFKCEICSKRFDLESNLKRHLKIHTEEKSFKCKICLKRYRLENNLKRHLKVHTGVKPFKCKVCSKQFIEKGDLKRHLHIHTGEKPFKCELCLKQFRRKNNLKLHLMFHNGEKPFECEICSKQFIRKDYLKLHLKKHNQEYPFKCEICSKLFTHKSVLTRHLQIHTGKKAFKCEKCPKEFSRKDNLNSHLKTHTGEKPYKCAICLKQFTKKGSLRRHLSIHTGEK